MICVVLMHCQNIPYIEKLCSFSWFEIPELQGDHNDALLGNLMMH